MNYQTTNTTPRPQVNDYCPKTEYHERRRLEMNKKLGVLNYRRDRLERELEAIKTALINLNHQMQRDAASEKISKYPVTQTQLKL